ncbi:Atp1b1p [Sparganum proliferum]
MGQNFCILHLFLLHSCGLLHFDANDIPPVHSSTLHANANRKPEPSWDPQVYYEYVDNLNALLDYYEEISIKDKQEFADCSGAVKKPNIANKVCPFSLTTLGPCNRANEFGYPENKPCVILKINRVYGWMPYIVDQSVPHVLVSCTGQNPEDKVNLGPLKFFPSANLNGTEYGKFDSIYFPFIGQKGYTSPLVAVQFLNPARHMLVLVECQLTNALNVIEEPFEFELFVD